MTEELSNLAFFLTAYFLLFVGVIGHDFFMSLFFLLAPCPALLEMAAGHLLLCLFQASLVEIALVLGLISAKDIFSMKERTTVIYVIFDALPALAIEKGLLVQSASTSCFVPLL